MIPMVDLKTQYLNLKEEIDAVLEEALANTHFIGGPNVAAFEGEAKEYLGTAHTVGTASGTDALQMALAVSGVGPGDEVITTPFTFIATASTVIRQGARPIFVDIDPRTFNLDLDLLEEAITPRTRAVIPVHIFGQPMDMTRLMEICRRHGLLVIEDAAQSFGARSGGKMTGTIGDLGCFSFYPSKNLGCFGDGGMLVTDSAEAAGKVRMLGNHGSSGRYIHKSLGYNSRLDDIQAAVLRVKLRHLDDFNRRRRGVAHLYNELLGGLPLETPLEDGAGTHVFHQYTILSDRRDDIAAALTKAGIGNAIHYPMPLYRQEALSEDYRDLDLPVCERTTARCLSLPIYPEMTTQQVEMVAETIGAVFRPGNPGRRKICIITGEVSGDQHAARLVEGLKKRGGKIDFTGMGGHAMAAAGVDIQVDSTRMAVIGFVEILTHAGQIITAFRTMRRALRRSPPDLLVLIDYSGFNLLMARYARKLGIRVLYYVSPQVWASRPGRIKKIRRYVDMIAVLFPFEEEIYREAGVPVRFVGHPLSGTVRPEMTREEALAAFSLDPDRKILGLLPGSRSGEITRLFPVILESAAILKKDFPDLQFVLPLAPSITREDLAPHIRRSGLDIRLVEGQIYDAVNVCDAVITASGTATLEIALLGVPMAIIYKVAGPTYHLGKRLIKVPYIGLCNIVAGKKVVQEFIQHEANPGMITGEVRRILTDDAYRRKIIDGLNLIRGSLDSSNAATDISSLVLEMLEKKV